MIRPSVLRPLRRTWSWPMATVAVAALLALTGAVATGLLPLADALALAAALIGG